MNTLPPLRHTVAPGFSPKFYRAAEELALEVRRIADEPARAVPNPVERKSVAPGTICQMREQLGLTQLQLARRLGTSQGSVCAWERGVRKPPAAMAPRLREIFGL